MTIAPRVAITRPRTSGPTNLEIAWTGSEYVLVWLERENGRAYRLQAMRFSAGLRPIDVDPFEIASAAGPLTQPAIIASPEGVLIAYSRIEDANGGAPAAFMRTLDRLAPPAHRRAAGH